MQLNSFSKINEGDIINRVKVTGSFSVKRKRINGVLRRNYNAQCICLRCGKLFYTDIFALLRKEIRSCGCEPKKVIHGLYNHKLYKVHEGMKTRCYSKNYPQYKDYGGRGIKICDEWKNDFMAFYKWALDNEWKEGLTIERIDNDGDYCPTNCKIATKKEQGKNKRNTVFIRAFGETKSISDWVEDKRCVVSHSVLHTRVTNLKWNTEKALTTFKGGNSKIY